MMLTDQQGNYEFETIMPGRYAIPPGLPGLEKYEGVMRPAHIHFRVSEPIHVPLTTQLYFKGDPNIANDPWAGANHQWRSISNRMASSCMAIWTLCLIIPKRHRLAIENFERGGPGGCAAR